MANIKELMLLKMKIVPYKLNLQLKQFSECIVPIVPNRYTETENSNVVFLNYLSNHKS